MAADKTKITHELAEDQYLEAPRYSCSLAGAYGTTLGNNGGVPILHSGAGCGIGQLSGTL